MTRPDPVQTSLHDLSRLTDAEQYFVWGWFATGARHYLYRIGVGDDTIGEGPLFPDDNRSEYDGPNTTGSADLLRWAKHLKLLPPSFLLGLRDWFFWHDRSSLYRAGQSDSDIGVRRVVPDDIWPYEDDYQNVADRTLEFVADNSGASVKVRVFLNGEWSDP